MKPIFDEAVFEFTPVNARNRYECVRIIIPISLGKGVLRDWLNIAQHVRSIGLSKNGFPGEWKDVEKQYIQQAERLWYFMETIMPNLEIVGPPTPKERTLSLIRMIIKKHLGDAALKHLSTMPGNLTLDYLDIRQYDDHDGHLDPEVIYHWTDGSEDLFVIQNVTIPRSWNKIAEWLYAEDVLGYEQRRRDNP